MALPTIIEMTNLFLYGTLDKPQDLSDESLIRDVNEVTDAYVDINEFMDGPGRYVSGADFTPIKLFLEGEGNFSVGEYEGVIGDTQSFSTLSF